MRRREGATLELTKDIPDRLLCGDCRVDVDARVEADGTKIVRCPACGYEDTLTSAMREAAKHGLDERLGGIFDGFKPTGAMRVHIVKAPKRYYRFVIFNNL